MPRNITKCSLLVLVLMAGILNDAFSFCFDQAGARYHIPPALIESLAYRESALNPKAIHQNPNGSFDYGLMQINSCWFKTLGLERWQQLSDPCFNAMVGAWILKDCIDRHGYTWNCISCYRSGKPLNELKEPVREDVISYIEEVKAHFEQIAGAP
jgi:soluble lytic murein transglycosylase-like protein